MASAPLPSPDVPVVAAPSRARQIFFGEHGLRAGWRVLLFILVVVLFEIAITMVLKRIPALHFLGKQAKTGILSPTFEFVIETSAILGLFLATLVMARLEKRSFWSYGLPLKGAFGKLFWQGAIWGLVFEAAEMFAMYALHGFSFGSLALSGFALVRYALAWALAFVLVGIFEEFLFRGYVQSTLASGIGFWPAAVVLSALFGATHLSNPGEGWVGGLSVMVFALFACFTLTRTGSLWFAIGFHAAGDYAETFIFSVPDSGIMSTGHLLNSTVHGPRWLTGGTIGPEGSALEFAAFVLVFIVFAKFYPAGRTKSDRPAPFLSTVAPSSPAL